FAIIAAIGLRRGLASERRRLLARGARRWQIGLALGAEIGAMTLAGAVGGMLAGTAVAAAIAASAGQPAGAILSHTLAAGWTLAGAPSRTVVSCAFVAVALGLALFAATYRATLARGAADQAAFQVPLDFTVSEGTRLVRPLDAAPLGRYEQLGGGASAYPVVRVSATTPGSGSSVLSPTLLGVPADAVSRLRWRSDFS